MNRRKGIVKAGSMFRAKLSTHNNKTELFPSHSMCAKTKLIKVFLFSFFSLELIKNKPSFDKHDSILPVGTW